jgi:hypothetical protein
MVAVAHRATVNWHHSLGKARRADTIIFLQMISARRKPLHCRPVGPEEEFGGLSDRGTSSPGIHCAGPLGLGKYCRPVGHVENCVGLLGLGKIMSARWAWGKLCRPVGHGENCVGLLGLGKIVSACWASATTIG